MTLVTAFVIGMLAAGVGVFGFDGAASVSAQTDTTAATVSSIAVTSDTDENTTFGYAWIRVTGTRTRILTMPTAPATLHHR